ncbi:MAG TPA: FISUMP domain-containing protein, partial [Bacteroidales bacterium]|nr:FISUMP domain-containing protein [Bacteroidales bacterium]
MKSTFFGFFLLITSLGNAQNYIIDFSATGAASSISSVTVENLTKNTTLNLSRNQSVRLIGTSGIISEDNLQTIIRIYPNPATKGYTIAHIYPFFSGNSVLTVYDATGKTEAQTSSYLGTYPQEFRISGLKNGIHFLVISGKYFRYSSRFIVVSNTSSAAKIERTGSENFVEDTESTENYESDPSSIINMAYTDGDRLKFTGRSGKFATVVTDIPDKSKTIDFRFVECTDADSNNYPVVVIGSQVWMAENLRTTRYSDGKYISSPGTDNNLWNNYFTGAYSWYKNSPESFKNTYGALYNWYAVNSGNLCPRGWRIPDDKD